MRTLKIMISIAAAVILAAGTAMTGGLFNVPAVYVQITLAIAGAISILGISPYQFDVATTRALSAIAVILTGIQAAHAGAVTPGPQTHPWLWSGLAIVTVIVGMLGKSPIQHQPAVAPVPAPRDPVMTLALACWLAGLALPFVAAWLAYGYGQRRGRVQGFADGFVEGGERGRKDGFADGVVRGVKMTFEAFAEADDLADGYELAATAEVDKQAIVDGALAVLRGGKPN